MLEEQKQADDHRGVANASHDECFARRESVYRIRVPEADQQVAAQPDAFPPEVEQQQVVRQQQRHHGSDEQVHISEETGVAFALNHGFGGVEVNEEADEK